jgi:hypothetical protein
MLLLYYKMLSALFIFPYVKKKTVACVSQMPLFQQCIETLIHKYLIFYVILLL